MRRPGAVGEGLDVIAIRKSGSNEVSERSQLLLVQMAAQIRQPDDVLKDRIPIRFLLMPVRNLRQQDFMSTKTMKAILHVTGNSTNTIQARQTAQVFLLPL